MKESTNIIRIYSKENSLISRNLIAAIFNMYKIHCKILLSSECDYINSDDKINKPLLNDIRNFCKGFLYTSGVFYTFEA